jgi:hypothetical protein
MRAAACLLALAAGVLPGLSHALDDAEERAERARIAAERAQAEAAYDERERVCRERFVVSSCLDDARRDRRHALERARQQGAVLDEGQRKKRAAERLEDIGSKVSAQDAQRREALARQQQREKERGEAVARRAAASGAASASAPEASSSAASAAADAASARARDARAAAAGRVAEYEKRQAEARAHREAVEQRNAERAAQGKRPARPLPGASAPATPR